MTSLLKGASAADVGADVRNAMAEAEPGLEPGELVAQIAAHDARRARGSPRTSALQAIAAAAHDRDDLFGAWRIGRVPQAFVTRRSASKITGYRSGSSMATERVQRSGDMHELLSSAKRKRATEP